MGILGSLSDVFLFRRTFKFKKEFDNIFTQTLKEISEFDFSYSDLAQVWLGVCPYIYFSDLFLNNKKWNVPIVRAFKKSNMVGVRECYELTQAFYLHHLFSKIDQDKIYNNYSEELLIQNIESNMKRGKRLIKMSGKFGLDKYRSTTVEDFAMCYIEKIFQIQYQDQNVLNSIISSIWNDSELLLKANWFTIQSIKNATSIYSQTSNE